MNTEATTLRHLLRSTEPAEVELRKINTFTISLLQQRSLNDLLWSLVENVANLLGFEDCVVYLTEGEKLIQVAAFAEGSPQLRENPRDFQLTIGEGIVGRVAAEGIGRVVRNTREEPDYIADEFSGMSEITVPIRFEGRVIGILDSESQDVNAYDQEDLDLLQFVANIAASRIASAIADEERRKAREERLALIAELEAKNAELELFNQAVSNDLKGPLLTIKGFLKYLEKDIADNDTERVQEDITRITAATHTMWALIDGMIKLSQADQIDDALGNLKLGALDLGEVVRAAVKQVPGVTERDAEIIVAEDLPRITGNRQQWIQVFQSLVDNAVKFSVDPPYVEIGTEVNDTGEVICTVRDNGIGIEPSSHQRIFGLFDRLDPKTEGAGIGLALVQRIVENHGGRVWVESAGEGKGATFFLILPAADPKSATS